MSTFGAPDDRSARQRQKTNGLPTKRVALGVIDCNINPLKNVAVDLDEKLTAQQKFDALCFKQKFQIFEDQNNICDNHPSAKKRYLDPSSSKILEDSNFKIFQDENEPPVPNRKRLSVFEELTLNSTEDENVPMCLDDSLHLPVVTPAELLLEGRGRQVKPSDVFCTPYIKEIYAYFKNREKLFLPRPDYMSKQTDLNMNMRCVLVDWLVEVGEEYKLEQDTLYLAVSFVDRFLSQMSVMREKLQLVGTASMFLASKFEEIYPPELSDFVYITDDTYTKKQILRMEFLLLKVLNFEVSVPTAYTFLKIFCAISNASQTAVFLAEYICELSLLDGNPFLAYTPSATAGAALSLANFILGHDMWSSDLEQFSGYSWSDFSDIILALSTKYSSISTSKQQAMFEKYKSSKYGSVSTIQLPGLPF